MPDRISDCLCPAGDLQLGENAADVGFHRCDADEHGVCDLLVAVSLHNEIQYFHLSFRQVKGWLIRWAGGLIQRPGGSSHGCAIHFPFLIPHFLILARNRTPLSVPTSHVSPSVD